MNRVIYPPLLLLSIAIAPFNLILNLLVPINILGKNGWLVAPVLLMACFYFHLLRLNNYKIRCDDIVLIFLSFLSINITLTHILIYSDIVSILEMRFIATSLLFIVISFRLLDFPNYLKITSFAIVFEGVIISIVRLINNFMYPNIGIIYNSNAIPSLRNDIPGPSRELLFGSSVSANIILCGMFVLLTLIRNSEKKSVYLMLISFQFVMYFGGLTTLSRYPIFFMTIIMMLTIINGGMREKKLYLLIIILFILLHQDILFYFHRFQLESFLSGGRLEKFLLGFQLTLSSVSNFLVGSSVETIVNTSMNGFLISDNSYVLVTATFGFPLAVVYFSFIFYKLFWGAKDFLTFIFAVYILIGFALTNCILWEPWVLIAFLSFTCCNYYGCMIFQAK